MAVGEDKVRTLITLTKQDKEDLEKLAKNDNRSLSSYIVNVLKTHMDEIRDSNYGLLMNEQVKGQQELKLEYDNPQTTNEKYNEISFINEEIEISIHKQTKSMIDNIVSKKLYQLFSKTYDEPQYKSKFTEVVSEILDDEFEDDKK